MELVFLGTSCMVPTAKRNQPAQLLIFKGENILVDCGEGTQRQFKLAGLKAPKITRILITHWHGDHVLGIPGILQTVFASDKPDVKIEILGPKGTRQRLRALLDVFGFDTAGRLRARDIEKGVVVDEKDFFIEAYPLNHRIECFGYRFVEKDRLRIDLKKAAKLGIPKGPLLGRLQKGQGIEWKGRRVSPEEVTYAVKGRVVSFVFDTLPCASAVKTAMNADLFVCEAVHTKDLAEKARKHKHLTAEQAAEIAKKANTKRLILTHLSQRYKTGDAILKEARGVFKNTEIAEDFMRVKV